MQDQCISYPLCSRSSTDQSGSGPPRSCERSRYRSGSLSDTSRGSTASSLCPLRWSWGWRRRKPPPWSAASVHPGYTASCRPSPLPLESSSGQGPGGSETVGNLLPVSYLCVDPVGWRWRKHLVQPVMNSCRCTAVQVLGATSDVVHRFGMSPCQERRRGSRDDAVQSEESERKKRKTCKRGKKWKKKKSSIKLFFPQMKQKQQLVWARS